MSVEAVAHAALDRLYHRAAFPALGIAVSGGGDSLALLHLARDWARRRDVSVSAVTVDHALRAGSDEEAEEVGRHCRRLGISHGILRWTGWSGRGNLQAAARRARRRLIAGWATERGIQAIALGHTRDDQAETVLLRLARGSGVDGLAGMREDVAEGGVRWLRPLLAIGRTELRGVLSAAGVGWSEDPTNEDVAYDRVKARHALRHLGPVGIDADGLVRTAERMQMARTALEQVAAKAARLAVAFERGDVVIDRGALGDWPDETRFRILAHAICWVSGAPYRPRFAALKDAAGARSARTVAGALLIPDGSALRVTREHAAVADVTCTPDETWDGRWRLNGPARPGDRIAALGDAVADCPDWRAGPLPRASLTASPALWRDGRLIAAPLAGLGADWSAHLVRDAREFLASL